MPQLQDKKHQGNLDPPAWSLQLNSLLPGSLPTHSQPTATVTPRQQVHLSHKNTCAHAHTHTCHDPGSGRLTGPSRHQGAAQTAGTV